MLKAVRFDEEKHKDLLDYIANYHDSKNRSNESEAIRFLMQLGMESLKNTPPVLQPIETLPVSQSSIDIEDLKKQINELKTTVYPNKHHEEQKPYLNIDEIKQQISNEIMSQINNQTFANLNQLIDKLNNIQIQSVPMIQSETPNKIESEPQFTKINTTKPIEIPADTNPLLANILANANR